MDIQLGNYNYPDLWYFIEQIVHRGVLIFVVETVRWNDDNEENETVKTERIPVAEFSDWWKQQELCGWRIVSE